MSSWTEIRIVTKTKIKDLTKTIRLDPEQILVTVGRTFPSIRSFSPRLSGSTLMVSTKLFNSPTASALSVNSGKHGLIRFGNHGILYAVLPSLPELVLFSYICVVGFQPLSL